MERAGGLSPGQLGRIESGERMPMLPSLIGVARALGVQIVLSAEGIDVKEKP